MNEDMKNENKKTKKQDKKDDLQKKYNELEHKYKRALADYQNLLKRTAVEKHEFVKYANEALIHEIIPVYDNLKLALIHAKNTPNNANIRDGVEYVLKQFKDILSNLGVEEIETKDKKFDPHTMEAIDPEINSGQEAREKNKKQGDIVAEEVRPGYKLHGKVIIPAKVILK